MRRVHLGLIVRLSVITVFIIFVIYLQSYLLNSVSQSFNFQQLHLINFITYSAIGFLINIINTNIFKKSVWHISLRYELLVFVFLYFIVASSQVFLISFILTIFLQLDISPTLGLIPFQILFGYSLVQLFLIRESNVVHN